VSARPPGLVYPADTATMTRCWGSRCAPTVMTTWLMWCGSGTHRSCGDGSASPHRGPAGGRRSGGRAT